MLKELPPTAGLPLRWRDFLNFNASSLENNLAAFLQIESVLITSSGTAALVIALEYLKTLSPRRNVLIAAYTCPLVVIAIKQAGLNVKLCDVAVNSYDFDLQALQKSCTPDVLCVIPTHLGGLAANLEPVMQIARQTGAYVIEDTAQALGGTWHQRPLGTIGDIGVFSLTCGKGLTIYEGGILASGNPSIRAGLQHTYRKLVAVRRELELLKLIQLIGYGILYNPPALSFVYGLNLRNALANGDEIKAVGDRFSGPIPLFKVGKARKRIGSSASGRLAEFLHDNRLRAEKRRYKLSTISGIKVLADLPQSQGTWPFLTLVFASQAACRKSLDSLWTSGLGVTKLFVRALNQYDYLKEVVPQQPMPQAEALAACSLTITNSHMLSDYDFELITQTIAHAVATA